MKSSRLRNYFIFTGLIGHIALLILFAYHPHIIGKILKLPLHYYYAYTKNKARQQISHNYIGKIEEQIEKTVGRWQPYKTSSTFFQRVELNGVVYASLNEAVDGLRDGDELKIYPGVYLTPFKLSANNVTIVGVGHVIFERAAYQGKAFIVNQGDNVTIKNIECRYIAVADKNGACIRQVGKGLNLEHVYFHHSESGLLESAAQESSIFITDSRFELLGKNGQAHGIYSNKAKLYITNSLFLATKSEGHAIKNRGSETYISNSIISSMSSIDSRLVDIPNGGKLTIVNSVLHQGINSANGEAIGFGDEGSDHKNNEININDNYIILERIGNNELTRQIKNKNFTSFSGNVLISNGEMLLSNQNVYFMNRKDAGILIYPMFPIPFCQSTRLCNKPPK